MVDKRGEKDGLFQNHLKRINGWIKFNYMFSNSTGIRYSSAYLSERSQQDHAGNSCMEALRLQLK